MDRWTCYEDAPALAEELLGAESVRFHHVAGVAEAAARASVAVPDHDVDLLVAAAWLHDIGYAESVNDTGFHPLDGARYLRRLGAPDRLCRLVAHHTASPVEAAGRGLRDSLMYEFLPEASATADVLTYADLTTGPDGCCLSVLERLMEILTRYPSDHVVHESIQQAQPELLATVDRVDARLAGIRLLISADRRDSVAGGPDARDGASRSGPRPVP